MFCYAVFRVSLWIRMQTEPCATTLPDLDVIDFDHATAGATNVGTFAAYTAVGFTKLHLDCSMSCADDPVRLTDEVVSRRAAGLMRVAEDAAGEHLVSYVIGTEVPPPGARLCRCVIANPQVLSVERRLEAADGRTKVAA